MIIATSSNSLRKVRGKSDHLIDIKDFVYQLVEDLSTLKYSGRIFSIIF